MISRSVQYITVCLLVSLICSISSKVISPKKRVCVIGAGVSGLVAVKYLTARSEMFETIAFDKNSDVGGLWIYSDSEDVDEHGLPVHSSVYKNLRTNAPKEFMAFPHYQEFHGENRSYARHETVLQYLQNYTDHFNLRPYIKFDTLVEKVTPLNNLKWRMQTINLNTGQRNEIVCDAVIVANGQSKPNIPKIPGIEKFRGRVLHSHTYRKPEEFANQTVVVLGASFSGMDIGIEVSRYANRVYLSHRHDKINGELPKNMIQVPGVVEATGDGFILSDGSKITADSLLLCTGYLFEFPFLDEKSGVTVEEGKYVHPLYKHIVNVEYPTMFFINIPHPSFKFWIADAQMQYIMALFEGKAKLPGRAEMLKDAELPEGLPLSKAHYLLEETGLYYDELAEAGGFEKPPPHFAEDVWQHVVDQQKYPLYYKEKNARRRPDGRWELVWP